MNTTTIAAKNLRAGDVIVAIVNENGRDRLIQNTVTSDARALGGTGLVGFGIVRGDRGEWMGRLKADTGVSVRFPRLPLN